MLVKIPGCAKVVIDAKTPHEQYDAALHSDNKQEQARICSRRTRKPSLDTQRRLPVATARKWVDGSPDFVMMYVPTDPMLDAAIKAEP